MVNLQMGLFLEEVFEGFDSLQHKVDQESSVHIPFYSFSLIWNRLKLGSSKSESRTGIKSVQSCYSERLDGFQALKKKQKSTQ